MRKTPRIEISSRVNEPWGWCIFIMPKGAKNIDSAKAFMISVTDPNDIADASRFTGYKNAIKASGDYLKDGLKEDPR